MSRDCLTGWCVQHSWTHLVPLAQLWPIEHIDSLSKLIGETELSD